MLLSLLLNTVSQKWFLNLLKTRMLILYVFGRYFPKVVSELLGNKDVAFWAFEHCFPKMVSDFLGNKSVASWAYRNSLSKSGF